MYCHIEELQDNQILLGIGLPLTSSPQQYLNSDFGTEKNEKNHVPETSFLISTKSEHYKKLQYYVREPG
jgi:hypothetical protein